jgi:peptide chain release factor subunit 1
MESRTSLAATVSRLAGFQPVNLPVISLYLNTQPNEHGQDNFHSFVRKELRARELTFEPQSAALKSYSADVQKIEKVLAEELRRSTNSFVIFACSGAGGFFETIQADVPLEKHEIYVDAQPHLYTLAKMDDQFPRYAAVLADTNSARIFVFALNSLVDEKSVQNEKTNRTRVGGWSQARYQRHVENCHLHHAKEVTEVLDRIVREEGIQHVIFAGDDVVIPLLREQLPPALAAKVVDILRLAKETPETRMLEATMESMRRYDAKSDAEIVSRLVGEYRAGGLATVGVERVLRALSNGQVDEVFLTASPEQLNASAGRSRNVQPPANDNGAELDQTRLAGEIVRNSKLTSAGVRFVEDPALLAAVGGVAARLRYRL